MRHLSDIVLKNKPLLLSKTTPVQIACERMEQTGAGYALIVDEADRLCGIFTGHDLVERVVSASCDASTTQVTEVMTADPVCMHPDCSAIEALRLMWDKGVHHLPVTRGSHVLGVVSDDNFDGSEELQLRDERELWEHMR